MSPRTGSVTRALLLSQFLSLRVSHSASRRSARFVSRQWYASGNSVQYLSSLDSAAKTRPAAEFYPVTNLV